MIKTDRSWLSEALQHPYGLVALFNKNGEPISHTQVERAFLNSWIEPTPYPAEESCFIACRLTVSARTLLSGNAIGAAASDQGSARRIHAGAKFSDSEKLILELIKAKEKEIEIKRNNKNIIFRINKNYKGFSITFMVVIIIISLSILNLYIENNYEGIDYSVAYLESRDLSLSNKSTAYKYEINKEIYTKKYNDSSNENLRKTLEDTEASEGYWQNIVNLMIEDKPTLSSESQARVAEDEPAPPASVQKIPNSKQLELDPKFNDSKALSGGDIEVLSENEDRKLSPVSDNVTTQTGQRRHNDERLNLDQIDSAAKANGLPFKSSTTEASEPAPHRTLSKNEAISKSLLLEELDNLSTVQTFKLLASSRLPFDVSWSGDSKPRLAVRKIDLGSETQNSPEKANKTRVQEGFSEPNSTKIIDAIDLTSELNVARENVNETRFSPSADEALYNDPLDPRIVAGSGTKVAKAINDNGQVDPMAAGFGDTAISAEKALRNSAIPEKHDALDIIALDGQKHEPVAPVSKGSDETPEAKDLDKVKLASRNFHPEHEREMSIDPKRSYDLSPMDESRKKDVSIEKMQILADTENEKASDKEAQTSSYEEATDAKKNVGGSISDASHQRSERNLSAMGSFSGMQVEERPHEPPQTPIRTLIEIREIREAYNNAVRSSAQVSNGGAAYKVIEVASQTISAESSQETAVPPQINPPQYETNWTGDTDQDSITVADKRSFDKTEARTSTKATANSKHKENSNHKIERAATSRFDQESEQGADSDTHSKSNRSPEHLGFHPSIYDDLPQTRRTANSSNVFLPKPKPQSRTGARKQFETLNSELAVTTKTNQSYTIQFASLNSRVEAAKAASIISQALASLLNKRSLAITEASISDQTFFRVRLKAPLVLQEAQHICSESKKRGQDCFVSKIKILK